MSLRIGINGFGRMGRSVLRVGWAVEGLEFVRINDPAGSAETLAHLLNFDSVHGRWDTQASAEAGVISIEGREIRVSQHKSPAGTAWEDCDLVIEASGKFKSTASLKPYLEQKVKRVVVTAPIQEDGNQRRKRQ